MTRRHLPAIAAIALATVLASQASGADVQLAPAVGEAKPGPQATSPDSEPSWKLCEVSASLLATAPGRNIVASEKKGFVYLGEDLDIESDVTIALPQGTALVHARARLRAAAATDDGVTYFIASDGVLRSTLGFTHPAAGQDQFRNEMLQVGDSSTRLHEIFALPDLALRVVMVLRVRPVAGRAELSARQMLEAPVPGATRRFRVEAFLKNADTFTPLEKATLATMDGREAGLSLTRFSVEGAGGSPAGMPGTSTVRMLTVPGAATRSAAEMGAVQQVPSDRRFQERIETLQRSMKIDPTVDLSAKLPGQRDIPGTPRKISERKKKKIQAAQKQAAVRDWAIEQSKKLPSSEAVPEGWQTEALQLVITPLRSTPSSLQVEIRLSGHVKLPKEETFTAIDTTLVEQMKLGEPLELGIADLVRENEPLYDYVLRITPEN